MSEETLGSGSDLHGRVVIVTGAGKGIGRACALHLAARGARVLANNRRHPGEADADTSAAQVVSAIEAAGGQALANWDAVDDPAAGPRMVAQALAAWGRLDAVVANAALSQASTFHKQSLDDFLQIFNVGFLGSLHLVHAAWPVMRAQGQGRVVFTTSSAGRYGNHGLGAYAASKGAIEALMRSLAAEGRGSGIVVNAVSPYAATQMTREHLPAPLSERLSPEAVAPVVAWLVSEACSASGEVVVTGGGRHRLAYTVETAGVQAADMETALRLLRQQPAHAHHSAQHAFETLVAEFKP